MNTRMHITLLVLALLGFTPFLTPSLVFAVAGVPKVLNHQGRLMDSAGTLLGGTGTDYCFKFAIYDDATVGGTDNQLWPAGATSTMTVSVKNGVFNVGVGDTSAGGDTLDYNFQDNDTVYLGVDVASKIGGTCAGGDEAFERLTPRQRVTASGYAVNASTVGGFTPSQTPSGNQIAVLLSGVLSVPTASSTLATTSQLVVSNSFTFKNVTGFLKAVAGVVSTALINLVSDVTGILGVGNGGTGWASIQSGMILYGNGSSAVATTTAGTAGNVLALLNGIPTWAATTTFSTGLTFAGGNVTVDTSQNIVTLSNLTTNGFVRTSGGTGALSIDTATYLTNAITGIGPTGQNQTGPAIAFATSSTAFNGLTASTTIVGSGNTLTFANTLAGTLGVAGGGTGSTTLTGILKGNGTGQIGTLLVGSGLSYDGATLVASGGGYNLIKDEVTSLTARTTLAFLGVGVTCADAGGSQTECTIPGGAGGGANISPSTADTFGADGDPGIWLNENGVSITAPLLRLDNGGIARLLVQNGGGLTINAGTSDIVKTTTGTTLSTDFSFTGSTLTNVTSANDLISINDGSVTNTMSTSLVVTSAAAGAGSQTILREDGQYIIIHGNSLATGSRWDGSATTMTSVTVATGAVNPGAGAIALKRPDGRYLIVHGNGSAGLTSLFDPRGITAIAAGPAVCGAGAATTGTNAFIRPDGKYVILCGNLTTWGVYDPTANTYTAGTAVAVAFGAGAHAIQRDDGTFLIFRGVNTTTHWIYNPYASATGTMTQDPITASAPTINTGAFSIRRADGKFLVMGGAVNTSSIYDPTRTSANSGAGSMTAQSGAGFGPTAALGDGAQAIWRQDGKYLLITGSTNVTNVVDPSQTGSSQFVAGPNLNANAAAGIHAVMRPDGAYQIIRGGAVTTTDIYNTGFIMGGQGSGTQLASYETECVTTTSLNPTSVLRWTGNSEGKMTFQVKTGTGSCSGAYKNIAKVGDLIGAAAGENRVQIKVFFQRDFPKFADQEWGLRRGLGQTRYRRTNKDPALYDVSVGNGTGYHRSQFEFGNSSDPSGPVLVNLTNNADRELAIALEMGIGYGSTINATNPVVYNGAFGPHPVLATTATAGTVVMKRSDGQFAIISGNTATANAQLYDPVVQTFTAQSGAGNIPTAGTGLGALAIKRPNGTFLMVVGNAGTVTNVYDPLAASGSQFVAGPALTANAGRGALAIPLPNGRVLILHGNFTNTSSIYDPIQNTMVAGPLTSAVVGGGSMAIPRPNGTYLVVLGVATEACTALNTVTNNFDPYTMIFIATGSPAITTGVGPGGFAFQRSDGQWVIVHGGGTASTCAGTTRTQIYNPITNKSVVGPVLSAVAQHGAHAIPRPDGTWLIVHGGGLTTTSIYLEKAGAFTAEGLAGIGQANIAGPALVTAASAGSISFQRDDGKFVLITGNAGTVVQQYDGGWISNGTYRSEAINVSDLDTTSVLVWKANADLRSISAEVKTATSKDNLQTASSREISKSGGLINPSPSETWININFNFKRTFSSHGGIFTDVWYNGGSPIRYTQRQISVPTLNEFKITKDSDLIDLKADGISVFRVNTNGDIYTSPDGAVNAGGADLAERYSSAQDLMPGEVVVTNPANPQGVLRSTESYQRNILGVVSTAPGFVAGAYTKDSFPIALIGRVPVKVSSEGGAIRAGDYLTSASIPGYAMRARSAGHVIGKAMQDFDLSESVPCPAEDNGSMAGARCGAVLMFVNFMDYMGTPVEVLMQEEGFATEAPALIVPMLEIEHNVGENDTVYSASAALASETNAKQWRILKFLKSFREETASALSSEVFTDRVTATLDVITSRLTSELVYVRTMEIETIIGTATSTRSTSLTAGNASTTVKFLRVQGGLDVSGDTLLGGSLRVDRIGENGDALEILADVLFTGRPVFSSDTGGFVRIEKDAKSAKILFERPYDEEPVVNVTLTMNEATSTDSERDDDATNEILGKGISYVVSRKSVKGFTLVLNKPAPLDLNFSWTALAVRNPKTFVSSPIVTAVASGQGLIIDSGPDLGITSLSESVSGVESQMGAGESTVPNEVIQATTTEAAPTDTTVTTTEPESITVESLPTEENAHEAPLTLGEETI